MSFRYQASSVSGFATTANSSKAFRPSLWAISANVAFSASDNNNLSRFNRSKKSARGGDPDLSKWSGPQRRRAARDQTALVFADDHAVHVYVV
jgi:hypothetical protein